MTEFFVGLVVGSVVERLCRHFHSRTDRQLEAGLRSRAMEPIQRGHGVSGG